MSHEVPDWLTRLAVRAADVEPAELSRFTPPGDGERTSAVLILFGPGPGRGTAPDEEADVLLLRRADALRSHAGQPAFPGGGIDPGETPVQAALREAREETGVDPAGVQVLAELPALFIPFSGYAVTPVLAWWRVPGPVWAVDPAEVAAVVRVPLAELRDPANRVAVTHPSGWVGPGYEVADMLVWGFTAGLLTRVLELAGQLPEVPVSSLPLRPLPAEPRRPAG